jgi:SAM-dependent methyltransferase
MPNLRGNVDYCEQCHVLGWAADENGAVPVGLWVEGQQVALAHPNMPRPDLRSIGLEQGFVATLPEPLDSTQALEVCHLDGTPLGGSPVTMHQERLHHLFKDLDLREGVGLEIGPLDRPILSKSRTRVLYVDHAPTEELRKLYSVRTDRDTRLIREVDIVWPGGSLKAEVGNTRYDYVLASHVMEHIPDMIGWLRALGEVLKPGGLVKLAVPDKEHTFDWRRADTTIAQLVSNNIRKLSKPCTRQIVDHLAFASSDRNNPPIRLRYAIEAAQKALLSNEYRDVHCQVFSQSSFRELFLHLRAAKLIELELREFYPTRPGANEFIASLGLTA